MQFFVYGSDAEGVGGQLDALGEAHWAYMDQFAQRLVARGPTLSPDGTAHTGSVHILEAADLTAARRFALEEPYSRAGLYSAVTVTPWSNALGGTMWDRPPASPETPSTMVIASWPRRPCAQDQRDAAWRALTHPAGREAFVFGGLLLGKGESETVGLAFALDRDLPDTERLVETLGCAQTSTSIMSHRWCRGGRPDG